MNDSFRRPLLMKAAINAASTWVFPGQSQGWMARIERATDEGYARTIRRAPDKAQQINTQERTIDRAIENLAHCAYGDRVGEPHWNEYKLARRNLFKAVETLSALLDPPQRGLLPDIKNLNAAIPQMYEAMKTAIDRAPANHRAWKDRMHERAQEERTDRSGGASRA